MRLKVKSLSVIVSMILLSLTGFHGASASEMMSPDSLALASVGKKLVEYVGAIEPLDLVAQKEECDFLISSCRDTVTRQYVASWLYRHYQSSHLMGIESVALHIADSWFFTGKVSAMSDADLMDMRIWAEFNRQSMVGKVLRNWNCSSLKERKCESLARSPLRVILSYIFMIRVARIAWFSRLC